MEKKKYLECALIINTHGVRGDVKLESLCDTPKVLADLKRVYLCENGTYREVKVLHTSIFKSFVLAALEEVDDMDKAMALKGKTLYAAREDFHLAEGQYFISDAIGLPVVDAREGREGTVLGVVEDILPNAASDIYSVKTPDGDEVLVPAIPVFIKDVIPGECVRMMPIDGMFENTDPAGDAATDKENG